MSAVAEQRGSAAIPEAEATLPASGREAMDEALEALAARREAWVGVDLDERIRLLQQLRRDTHEVAEDWVARACRAKGLEPGSAGEAEEWLGGPFAVIRNLRLLERSLRDVREHGRPLPPGPVEEAHDGRLSVGVFPVEGWEKLLYPGFSAAVRMPGGVAASDLGEHQARIYRDKAAGRPPEGRVALVLGAGNVASIGPMDALYKLFVEDQVALLKMNPVNDWAGPYTERAFRALVERDFVRVVYGGKEEGAYLCQHERVDEIHITGSDKTHDAIVFGPGEEGAKRKAAGERLNERRITSELGNVSPIVVPPGPWSKADLEYQAANVASSLVNNAGFNCNATRVLVTAKGWPQREAFLDALRRALRAIPPRRAYYPGAAERMRDFLEAHPEAEPFGGSDGGEAAASSDGEELPWTFVPGLDPEATDDPCFRTEAFCGLFGEVPLEGGDDVGDFLDRAVAFCNDRLWGTLNAALLVHPSLEKDERSREAVERAIDELRYGSVVVNHWPAVSYALVVTPWGAYPGHALDDVQSGIGVVHNTFMLDEPEKAVVRGPFRMKPTPPWFVTHRNAATVARRLARFEAEPRWWRLPGIMAAALRG